MNRVACCLILIVVSILNRNTAHAAVEPLRVLFLGDGGLHHPADRAAQLIPALAGRGIDITYTQDVGVLNAEFLARFDALILYGNIERIAPERVGGLIDYVEAGGGFVALHCASFCAQNSPEFAALVGARFQGHGTGTFETKIVAPDHPIMRGFQPFATWDETYIHEMHNETNRTVLQTRSEGEHAEPWTWVRTQGKGRVFYTAYGHDARTWMNPGFQALVERGIRWVANDGEVFDSLSGAHEGLPPFEYTEALLPNYIPSEKWGAQGEPITTMQQPLDPAASMAHLVVPPGFEPRLYAAEPEIAKPIAMNWDARGRIWIAETFDYPNNLQPAGQGHDRITICEDTDGDGAADSFKVFAEGLSIPTSLAFAFGGVIVHQAPHTLFLKDTDGDEVADLRKPILTGWKTDDTHAGPSNLGYGFDNWYYGMVGYAGFEGRVAGEDLRFRQGFYRFKLEPPAAGEHVPEVSKLEFLRSTNNNSWGVGLSEEGLIFGSTANGCPSVFLAIANRYYESVAGWAPGVLESISPSNRFFPITETIRQVDWHGGFTAAAGHAIYTARVYPELYWNRTAFVSDPTGHLTATFVLQPKGSGFAAYNSWNLVASDDEWTAPIAAEVGPDGHVWVIDWYNYIVQHNPTPRGFETGKGSAYITPLRDKRHGRIYRIEYQGDQTDTPEMALRISDAEGLVAALDHPNLGWRLHAQRLLIERGKRDVVERLTALISREHLDRTGLDAGAVHALCVLNGLGVIDEQPEIAFKAFSHPSAAVRRIALGMLPAGESAIEALVASDVLADDNAQVRLAALLALSEQPESELAADVIAASLRDESILADHWLADALTVAAASQAGGLLRSFDADDLPEGAKVILARVAEHYARRGEPGELPAILAWLSKHPELAEPVLAGFAAGTSDPLTSPLGKAAAPTLEALFPQLEPSGQSRLVRLAGLWGIPGLERYAERLAKSLLETTADEKVAEAARLEAARRVVALQPQSTELAEELLDLVTLRASPELRDGLIEAAANSNAPRAGALFVERLSSVTPAARESLLRALLSRPEWTRRLLDGIEDGSASLSGLGLEQRQSLANHPDENIAERATQLMEAGGGLPDADRQKIIEKLLPLVRAGGDVGKGKLVFTDQCAKCHQHQGEGSDIGPDLTGMASHRRDELLVHILDPSRSVEGNYRQYTVVTKDGLVISGLLSSETRTSLEIIDSEGKRHSLVRDDVLELVASTKSVMPVGFEKQMTPEELRDLLAFLTHKGRFVPLDLRKAATITSVRGMFYDKQGAGRIELASWSPRTIQGVPFRFVDPRKGRVANMILLHSENGAYPPRMPESVRLPVHTSAKAIHFLGGVAGWAFPLGEKGSSSMIVRLHYADGATEDHVWRNGIEIADYIRVIKVPKSKLAFEAHGRQMRFLSVIPERDAKIAEIELIKGADATAPLVMAVTVETD